MTSLSHGETVQPAASTQPASPSEFVTFMIGAEAFALQLGQVKEIIRMPALMHLPLAPHSLEGITNLRGAVLPVLSLRRAFGMPLAVNDEATRVVVLDIGRPVGIVVDRMLAVEAVDPARIDGTGAIGSQVDSALMVGVIRHQSATAAGPAVTMILDIEEIVRRECKLSEPAVSAARDVRTAEANASGSERPAEDVRQFVSFVVEGQEYALPIADVREIVHVPKSIAAVPNASPAVVGMVTLRDRLLPILSLRQMLGLPERPVSADDRVIVVSPSCLGHTLTVGILTDAVREVLRINVGIIDPMPPMLADSGGLSEISAVCRLEDGKRLVSVLDPARLFLAPDIQAAAGAAASQATDGQAMADSVSEHAAAADEQVVIFKLGDEEFGVTIDAVQEIVRLPDRLIRVPNAPDFIEGIMNLRGTIVPLVDQRRRFGLAPIERNERQRVVVFTLKGVRSGFIVDSVVEVRRISLAQIAPAPEVSDEQTRLISRIANLPDRKRMIQLLDVAALLDTREIAGMSVAAAA
jgi:purine-binding chemotaxis protein CheW